MVRIFVSYSRVDRPFVEEFVTLLRTVYGNNNVWFDKELRGGQVWWNEICRQIKCSYIFLYLLSGESVRSLYCQAEYSEAYRLYKKIIPVLIRDRTDIPANFSCIQIVDLSKGLKDAEGLALLYAAINQNIGYLPLLHLRARSPHQTPLPEEPPPSGKKDSPVCPVADPPPTPLTVSRVITPPVRKARGNFGTPAILVSLIFLIILTFTRSSPHIPVLNQDMDIVFEGIEEGISGLYRFHNGVMVPLEEDIQGNKHSPIVFNMSGYNILAYILIRPGEEPETVLRTVSIDEENEESFAIEYSLTDGYVPDPTSRMAFIPPNTLYIPGALYITGIAPDGSRAIFELILSDRPPRLVVENAYNPAVIPNTEALIIERDNDQRGHIFVWFPGMGSEPAENAIERGMANCFDPIGDHDGRTFEFVCEVDGNHQIYERSMYSYEVTPIEIGNSLNHLALGPEMGEFVFNNNDRIFWYHDQTGNWTVAPLVNGGSRPYVIPVTAPRISH